MSEPLATVMHVLEPELLKVGFVKKGKARFVKSNKEDFGREEYIVLNQRKHTGNKNAFYISCMCGILYKGVRKIDTQIVKDHINTYPIIAGSISQFSKENKFFSIEINQESSLEQISKEILQEILAGAFNLFQIAPTLHKLYQQIQDRHPFFKQYDFTAIYCERTIITLASIIYCLNGKQETLD
ncbi:hypothetical protein ACYSNX_08415 [Myroides sp. LJL115]